MYDLKDLDYISEMLPFLDKKGREQQEAVISIHLKKIMDQQIGDKNFNIFLRKMLAKELTKC